MQSFFIKLILLLLVSCCELCCSTLSHPRLPMLVQIFTKNNRHNNIAVARITQIINEYVPTLDIESWSDKYYASVYNNEKISVCSLDGTLVKTIVVRKTSAECLIGKIRLSPDNAFVTVLCSDHLRVPMLRWHGYYLAARTFGVQSTLYNEQIIRGDNTRMIYSVQRFEYMSHGDLRCDYSVRSTQMATRARLLKDVIHRWEYAKFTNTLTAQQNLLNCLPAWCAWLINELF